MQEKQIKVTELKAGKHICILTTCTREAALTKKKVSRSICDGLTSMVKKMLMNAQNLNVKETKTTENNRKFLQEETVCRGREAAAARESSVSRLCVRSGN